MTELKLSEAEKCYLINGINDDFRIDGRQCLDRQEIDINIDLISNCAGSAQIRSGNCQVLVGIKMNLIKPEPEEPQKGKIEFFVDISANASPFFEGKEGQNISNEIKSLFDHSFKHCQFLDDLCIIKEQSVWCIFVDILILETGSKPSLCDACSIAVFSALYSTKIPKVTVNQETNEIEISDNPFDVVTLNVENIPIFVTLTRISNRYILDPTQEEEASSISSILFAVTPSGDIVHIKQLSFGSLHSDPIQEAVKDVKNLALNLHQSIRICLTKIIDQESLND